MKLRLILSIIILIHVYPAAGQWSFYRQGGAAEKSRGRPVFTGGYVFVNCATMEAPGAGAAIIYKYDSAGTRIMMPYDKYIWSMQSTFDNKLLSISQERRCSYRLDTLDYFFEKIDLDGSVLASVSLTNGATEFIQTLDSNYIVFLWDNKTIVRYDKGFNFLGASSHTFGTLQGSMLCSDGKIAIAHMGSAGQKLSIISATGQMLSSKTITFSPTLVRPKGSNRITAYANEMFYEFDYSLNLQKSFAVKHLFDYFVSNDSVYTVFRDSLQASRIAYGVFNSNMKIIFKTNVNGYIPFSLCKVKKSVAVLFEPDIISMGRVNHCLSVQPKLSGFNVEKSMMLAALEVDSSYYELRSDGFYNVFARLNYGIVNGGTDVDRYTISVERSPDILCGKFYTWQEFNEFIPQMGSSSAQSDGFLQTRTVLYNGIIQGTYCAVVNQADGEFDATPANNVICVYPYFEVTGLSERSSDDRKVQVFPNPFENVITVVSEEEMKLVELMSVQGQVVFSSEASGSRNTLNMGDLSPGFYILRVQTPDRTFVKRLVAK